jgi:hypothetical protein
MTLRCGGLAVLQPARRCDRLSAVFRLNCATDNMTWPNRTGGGRGGDNRDYRWSSTPDADRCAVFGIRLGQRPSEPRAFGSPMPSVKWPRMRLISWKPLVRGSLRGFATVELPIGLKIFDCPILTGPNGPRASLPSKPQIDKGRQKTASTARPPLPRYASGATARSPMGLPRLSSRSPAPSIPRT